MPLAAIRLLNTSAPMPTRRSISIAGGRTLEQLPLSELIGPAAVIDFAAAAEVDPDALLGLGEIKRWEAARGDIPAGAIVVARSGWGRFWPNRQKYLGLVQSEGSEVQRWREDAFSRVRT